MSRKKQSIKREIKPDSKYSSILLSKFINKMMKGGNKSVVENIVYKSIEILNKKVNETSISGFDKSINNVKPLMEVKSRRVGGSTYQVPIEVKKDRAISLAMRWIIKNSRNKSGKSMVDQLATELIDAYNQTGMSIKNREETHRMAEANKAFSHFRW